MTDTMQYDLSKRDDIESILIVRLKALGDIVLSLPIIDALRARFPRAWIGYLCWEPFAEALSGKTGLDEVITLEKGWLAQAALLRRLRRRRIDVVLDLLSSPRSALLTWLSAGCMRIGMDVGRHGWCYHHVIFRGVLRRGKIVKRYTMVSNWEVVRLLGLSREYAALVEAASGSTGISVGEADRLVGDAEAVKGFDYRIGFPAAERERAWAGRYIGALDADPMRIVGIAPGSTYRAKSWPAENFIALAKLLVDRLDLTPLLMWGPGEEELARGIHGAVPGSILAPRTGIARLGALIARLPLLIGLDTGPKHIAVLEGTPTVTLFGPTDPEYWDPMTDRHIALHKQAACFPCKDFDCAPNRCLTEIEPEDVLRAVAEMRSMEAFC